MKRDKPLFLEILIVAPSPAQAQPCTVNWFTIHDGGGVSSGVYAACGTIGEPDVAQIPGDDTRTKTLIINPSVGAMFYRLRKPGAQPEPVTLRKSQTPTTP